MYEDIFSRGLSLAGAAASAGVADFTEKGVDKHDLAIRSGAADWMRSWNVVWNCDKWSEDACDYVRVKLGLAPDTEITSALLRPLLAPDLGEVEIHGNVLLNNGINRLLNLLIGTGSIIGYTNLATRVCVGDTSTLTGVATCTDLQAAVSTSNRYMQVVTAADVVSAQTVTATSDFTTSNGNFAWNEWGIDGGTTNGGTAAATNTATTSAMLNRKVESLGTKTTGTWTLAGAITIA